MRACANSSILSVCVGLLLSGCVEARYRYNSQHVYITPWTHLSAADLEDALKLFSRSSRLPIIGITATESDSKFPQFTILSGFEHPPALIPWEECILEKRPDGWHILDSGPISQFTTKLILSTPPSPSHHDKKT